MMVSKLFGGGPNSLAEVSDQEGRSLSSYSPEELAKNQRNDLVSAGFLESGTVPQDSELIL